MEISGVRSLADTMRFEAGPGPGLSSMVESFSQEKIGAGWTSYRVKLKVPASQLADKLLAQDLGGLSAAGDRAEPGKNEGWR